MAFACWASFCWPASFFPDQFDDEFEDAADLFLPGIDWRLSKAQCYQESLLDPLAISPAGAQGICQFMPMTWAEVSAEISLESVWNPEASILASAYYMSKLHKFWSSPRPLMDRHMLALASYNAGAGNLAKAQRICSGALLYREISPCLPAITGHHSEETLGYVDKIIRRWWPAMLLEG